MGFDASSSWQLPDLFIPEKLLIRFSDHQTWSFLLSLSLSLSQNTNNFMPFLLFSKRNKQRHFSKSGQSMKSLTETLNYTPIGITYIDMLASYWKADYFACLVFYSGMMLYIFIDETILPSSISQTPRSETLLLLCIDGVLLRLLFNIVVALKLDDMSVSNLLLLASWYQAIIISRKFFDSRIDRLFLIRMIDSPNICWAWTIKYLAC